MPAYHAMHDVRVSGTVTLLLGHLKFCIFSSKNSSNAVFENLLYSLDPVDMRGAN